MLTADREAPSDTAIAPLSTRAGTTYPGHPVDTTPLEPQPLVDLAQVLAHRIRNLLAGIEGFTDLLADTLGTPEQRDMALRILESTSRIESVLSDLQRYSEPLDVWMLPLRVGDVIGRLQAVLDEDQRRHLCLAVEDEDQALLADPWLLQQTLLLLAQNAFEASPPNRPVRLSITSEGPPHPTVRFDVWNEGAIDIDRATERVFEPFFTTKADNLGIGLPIARRIAEAHGGTLSLTANNPTEGICFSLCLPPALHEDLRAAGYHENIPVPHLG